MSENIIKSYETNDYIAFKIECDCLCHDLHVTLEKDKEFGCISLELRDDIYVENLTESKNPFVNFWERVKIAWSVLTKGYFETNYGFIFKNKEQLDDFVNYLNHCKEKFEK